MKKVGNLKGLGTAYYILEVIKGLRFPYFIKYLTCRPLEKEFPFFMFILEGMLYAWGVSL